MNDKDTKEKNLSAAEYVLGILDAQTRERFEQALAQDSDLHAEVIYWEDQLAEVGLKLPPVTPPASIWRGIEMQTGVRVQRGARGKARVCAQRVTRWRAWASAASVAAIAAATLLVITAGDQDEPNTEAYSVAATSGSSKPRFDTDSLGQSNAFTPSSEAIDWSAPEPAEPLPYLSPDFIGKIQDYASSVGWRVAGDHTRGALQVVATGTPYTRLWEPSTLELWLLPVNAYEDPISLGLLPAKGERLIPIPKQVASEFYTDNNKLAVSVEPPGGSPTGRPTGDILFITTLTRATQP